MDTKTLYAKLATVPTPIKTWLGSEVVIDDLDKIEQQFHLPEGSSATIAKLLQRIQIKDMGVEYLWGGLALGLKLEKDKAKLIVDEIKRTILAPINNDLVGYGIDLSLLDKFEMPIARPANVGPTILQEVKPTVATSTSGTMPQPPKPAAIPEKGWSGMPTIIASRPTPMAQPKPVGEFERLAATKIPVDGKGSVGPGLRQDDRKAPTIIQSTPGAPKPIQNAPDFRLPASAQNIMGGARASVPVPPRPAVIETGQTTSQKAWAPASAGVTNKDTPKVVHYGEFTSSLPAAMPTGNKPPIEESGRKLTEITPATVSAIKPAAMPVPLPPKPPLVPPKIENAPVPMPMKPPMPSTPPLPPKPNSSQPIVKDFLDEK